MTPPETTQPAVPDPGQPPALSWTTWLMRFGGVVALREVNLRVEQGQIAALIGPNGAGKTTVFNVVTGVCRPTEGAVRFLGQRIDGVKRFKIVKQGVARTFQNIRLFANMSALENVMVGADAHHRTGAVGAALGLPWHRTRRSRAGPRRPSCWTSSASRTASPRVPATCPTATSGASRSPGRWHGP